MNWKDVGLRLMWTIIAAVAGVLTVDQLPTMADVQGAGIVGAIAGWNFVLLLVRKMAAGAITMK
jgi:hypothetical protein